MKAITYLQNMGAIPQFDLWDLKMSVIVITHELFCEEMVMEPDCLEWVQSVNEDMELFNQRCDLILYASSGNVIGLAPILFSVSDARLLQELIEQLLDLRLFLHGIYKDEDWDRQEAEEEWFVRMYNDFVELDLEDQLESKSQILRVYYGGALTEIGEKVLRKLKISKETGKVM